MVGAISQTTFGTLHIEVKGGTAENKMKKELLKMAKKEKLDFAYIVRQPEGATSLQLYRVDVESGEETLVRTQSLTLSPLKKMEELGPISLQENVLNQFNGCGTSLIYPASFILPEFEINASIPKVTKAPALTYPLQR